MMSSSHTPGPAPSPATIINLESTTSQHDTPSIDSSSLPEFAITLVVLISTSAMILALVISLLCKRFGRTSNHAAQPQQTTASALNSNSKQCHENDVPNSLPLFTFSSVTRNLTAAGDCAVCLSKFEPHDQLRLLPLCCHAFHSQCIDTWLISNHTCPLCRSTVQPSDSDLCNAIQQATETTNNRRSRNGGSFRIEIGSISRRETSVGGVGQSYPIGSFEYIVDSGYEVPMTSSTNHHEGGASDNNSVEKEASEAEALAREVSGRRNWLREYVDSLNFSSRAMSLRGSVRRFSHSISRNDARATVEDLEANRFGEEISNVFRWLSGY